MVEMETNRLTKEIDFYAAHKDEWLRSRRAYYAVIKAESVLGFFDTFEAAYSAGAHAWGTDVDFLVKQIVDDEPTPSVF